MLNSMNQAIRQAAEYIQANWQQELPLRTLSQEAGLSPFHFQRSFKSLVGVTPRQFQEACRLRALKQELRAGDDILDAIFAAGFGSPSRVYERVDTRLGMTPSEYRAGGAHVGITHATIRTRLGLLTIGATDRGLCFVEFGTSEDELIEALRREYPSAQLSVVRKPWPEALREWVRALELHLEGSQHKLDLPLDIRATAFQMRVWRYLQSIPYGQTRSYRQVAEAIGKPTAARAVAIGVRTESCGAGNPLPSRDSRDRRARRLPLGVEAEARLARSRAGEIFHVEDPNRVPGSLP